MLRTRVPAHRRRVLARMLAVLVVVIVPLAAGRSVTANATAAPTMHETYRPQFHFTPQQNWMNDPNGPIYYKGQYHLFFQYNPSGTTWGNMSWGHAVSTDLVHWKQLPLAIPQDDSEMVFSGSVVFDRTNSSGLGTSADPPLVAIYTSQQKATGLQEQALAYSTDGGTTWTKYAGNPVLNINSQNFRDPKVFWYAPTKSWLMVLALSDQHKVSFYSSPDLRTWRHLSDFGPAGANGGVWECPDLFQLPVDGQPGVTKWVLVVNSLTGDLGAEYFTGDFDGTTFTSDEGPYTAPAGTTLADFESGYAGWTADGDAFGDAPAQGTLPGQQQVSGYQGNALVNTFRNGDASTGTLTSDPFTVNSRYLNLLVGGGRHPHVDGTSSAGATPDGTTIAGFDGPTWGDGWTATGDLAGGAPAHGSLPGQQNVSGFTGSGLVNTFLDGDATTGTLTSPPFTVTSHYLDLLVGGGDHPAGAPGETAAEVLVDGALVASVTGRDSEALNWQSIDLSAWQGKQAQVRIVDANSTTGVGSWGHLLVDDLRLSGQRAQVLNDFESDTSGWGQGWTGTGDFASAQPTQESLPNQQGARALDTCVGSCDGATGTITSAPFTVTTDYLDFLVAGGNHPHGQPGETSVNLVVDGTIVRSATGNNSGAMDWTAWDVSAYRGRQAQLEVIDDADGSAGWGHLMVDDVMLSDHKALPLDVETAVDLIVDGQVVRSATGSDSETLDWASWDLADLQGKQARIQIVDHNTSGWGHILVDQIMQSAAPALTSVQRTRWVDYGADYYATTTYNDAPDGQRIMMAWMNDWAYANDIPTAPWRSADAFPRTLALTSVDGRLRLAAKPVNTIRSLYTTQHRTTGPITVASGQRTMPVSGATLDITAMLKAGTAKDYGLDVRTGPGQYTRIGYDATTQQLYIDRGHSGDVTFNAAFTTRQSAPLQLGSAPLSLRILVDASSVEVYAQDGLVTLTDQVFPDPSSQGVSAFATGGTATVQTFCAHELASSWR